VPSFVGHGHTTFTSDGRHPLAEAELRRPETPVGRDCPFHRLLNSASLLRVSSARQFDRTSKVEAHEYKTRTNAFLLPLKRAAAALPFYCLIISATRGSSSIHLHTFTVDFLFRLFLSAYDLRREAAIAYNYRVCFLRSPNVFVDFLAYRVVNLVQ
jgi:hypothetical protein